MFSVHLQISAPTDSGDSYSPRTVVAIQQYGDFLYRGAILFAIRGAHDNRVVKIVLILHHLRDQHANNPAKDHTNNHIP